MKPKLYVFLIVSFASLITGNLISQPTFGQSEFLKDLVQREKERFLELGEEKFREDCYNQFNFTNDSGEWEGGFNPEDVITNICEGLIGKIKNQTGTVEQIDKIKNQTGTLEQIGKIKNQTGTLEQNQTFNRYALTNVNNTYFSIDVPDNWMYVEGSSSSMAELIGFGPKVSVFLIPTEVVVSISNLNTSAEENKSAEIMKQGLVVSVFAQYSDYPLKNAPLEVLVKNITSQIPHQITSRQNLTIDNETAVKIYADGVNDMSGTKFVEYYIMHDKEPYIILYLANVKDFEIYLPEFEQIVKTFKFTK
ncbi:MAG TPA: PsbP-related protein [Nitrososphaeraceae archaeon]